MIQYDIELYEEDLIRLFISNGVKLFGVTDARYAAYTNEHTFFLRKREKRIVLSGDDLIRLDKELRDKLL